MTLREYVKKERKMFKDTDEQAYQSHLTQEKTKVLKEEGNRIELLQYTNLRRSFSDLVTRILSGRYYNLGHDVYTCDQLTCEDLENTFLKYRRSWRISIGMNIGFIIGFIIGGVLLCIK